MYFGVDTDPFGILAVSHSIRCVPVSNNEFPLSLDGVGIELCSGEFYIDPFAFLSLTSLIVVDKKGQRK